MAIGRSLKTSTFDDCAVPSLGDSKRVRQLRQDKAESHPGLEPRGLPRLTDVQAARNERSEQYTRECQNRSRVQVGKSSRSQHPSQVRASPAMPATDVRPFRPTASSTRARTPPAWERVDDATRLSTCAGAI